MMSGVVHVGAFAPATRAMGPGLRACLWVQGCPLRCAGCSTPEFMAMPEGHPYFACTGGVHPFPWAGMKPAPAQSGGVVPVSDLCTQIDRAIAEHKIEGVSFSGGEPFAQAQALAAIARHARTRGLSTLAWSGWIRDHLEEWQAPSGSHEFLAALDVLIDGPYVRALGTPQPLRGSRNQRIHFLTRRYRRKDVKEAAIEVHITNGRVVVSGVTDYDALRAALAVFGVW